MESAVRQSPHRWRWSISPGFVQLLVAFPDRAKFGSFQCALRLAIPAPRSTSTLALDRANSSQSQRKRFGTIRPQFSTPSGEKKRVLENGLLLLFRDCEQLSPCWMKTQFQQLLFSPGP